MTGARPYTAAAGVLAAGVLLAGCTGYKPVDDTGGGDAGSSLTRTLSEQDRPAAPDLGGTTLDGETVHLSDYRGDVVVVSAWGSWCGPCVAEAPELKKFQQKWRHRGVRVLGLDDDAESGRGLAFQKKHRLGFPSLSDPQGRLGRRLPRGLVNPQALPYTVVVDPRGRIAASRMGAVTEAELADVVTPLLRAPRPQRSPAPSRH
ncbi:TlpA disulfide reductase family protein [Streptomyces sp. NPDC046881]|uniref:TlpA family protein disulfide reductase n=1 Tax=Streptomyces sp. NPDC046881 TaxID=3155374 RepID=UPI0033FF5489